MARPPRRKLLLTLLGAHLAGTALARARGYRVGGRTVVRCRQGHLFTTLWIPGVSVKALRLGWWRLQRCPVGRHWSLVAPVRESELSGAELQEARSHTTGRLP